MSEYKNIIGTHIKTVTADPPNPENGQMWYNSTTKVVKGFTANPAGAWAAGGNLNTAREWAGDMSIGTQTSSLVTGKGPPGSGETESYNGTSWTEVADLNSGRYNASGVGPSNTSALAFGGEAYPNPSPYYRANTETWNGSGWTEVADLNTGKQYMGSAGNVTSALAFGGEEGPTGSTRIDNNESWNGSAWTEVADMNEAQRFRGGAGASNTAAIAFGGEVSPANVEISYGS
jgi:hypothetical protein